MKKPGEKQTVEEKKMCPYLEDPYDDCFIENLHSLTVACCLNYCSRNFEDCKIYRNHSKGTMRTQWNVLT